MVAQVAAGHTTPQMTNKYIDKLQSKRKLDEIMRKGFYSTPTQPPNSTVSLKKNPENP